MLKINPEEELHNMLSAFIESRIHELEQNANAALETNLELLEDEQEIQRYLELVLREIDYLKDFINRAPHQQTHQHFQQGYQQVIQDTVTVSVDSLITYYNSRAINFVINHQEIYNKIMTELVPRCHLLVVPNFNLTFLNGQRLALEGRVLQIQRQLDNITDQRLPYMTKIIEFPNERRNKIQELTAEAGVARQNYQQTLHALCERGELKALIQQLQSFSVSERRIKVNQIDSYGYLPLHIAALKGHTEVVHYLLSQGAISQQKDSGGFTAWHRAAEGGHIAVLKVLAKALTERETVQAHINTVTSIEGYTPLTTAVFHGKAKAVKWLIHHGARVNQAIHHDGSTALHAAATRGHLSCIQLLLNAGANGHVQNKQGETPAYLAIIYHQPHILAELMNNGICLTDAELERLLAIGDPQMLEDLMIVMQERSLRVQVTLASISSQANSLTAPRRFGLFLGNPQTLQPQEYERINIDVSNNDSEADAKRSSSISPE